MNRAGQVKIGGGGGGGGGGQVAFVFRLPAGQDEFSGLFLTLMTACTCNTKLSAKITWIRPDKSSSLI